MSENCRPAVTAPHGRLFFLAALTLLASFGQDDSMSLDGKTDCVEACPSQNILLATNIPYYFIIQVL